MRIPLGDLEELRSDPASYRERLRSEPTPRSFSRTSLLYLAVSRYHQRSSDLNAALDYLDVEYERKFQDPRRLAPMRASLVAYGRAFQALNNTMFAMNHLVRLDFPGDVHLTGMVRRLDMTASGYSACLFTTSPIEWRGQMRMPLVQDYLAQKLGVSASATSVGIYDFSSGTYGWMTYSAREIAAARREMSELAQVVSSWNDLE